MRSQIRPLDFGLLDCGPWILSVTITTLQYSFYCIFILYGVLILYYLVTFIYLLGGPGRGGVLP
jgi:hypothetical protein